MFKKQAFVPIIVSCIGKHFIKIRRKTKMTNKVFIFKGATYEIVFEKENESIQSPAAI